MRINSERCLFITYARVIAMVSVIMVHLCQQSTISLVRASAQVFISGVTTFIILTGFLFGRLAQRAEYPRKYSEWFASRSKRILVPYYFVIVAILVFNILNNQATVEISLKDFMMFLVCVQDFMGDFFYRIPGAGHLWYITMLILLYLTMFVCLKYRKPLLKWGGVLILILVIVQILVTIFLDYRVGRYLFYMLVGTVSFWVAYTEPPILKRRGGFIALTAVVVVLWIIRIGLYFKGCDTYIYNNLYTYYTQALLSVWIVCTLAVIDHKGWLKPNRLMRVLDDISYEVYLVHFMFIVGPLNIVGRIGYLAIEGILVCVVSVTTGYLLSKVTGTAMKRLDAFFGGVVKR